MSPIERERLRGSLEAAGQDHLLRHLERLDAGARARLEAELAELDFRLLAEQRQLLAATPALEGAVEVMRAPRLDPPELFPLRRGTEHEREAERAVRRGRELLETGRVGYVLVAGGQGSRLGLDGPKGVFRVGPVSGRSLFEIHAARLRKAGRGGAVRVPWYVMTSPANDATTRAFFEENRHFGLDPADVFFFSQDMLPALDPEGRILLQRTDALFRAPNGHGGVLLGLASSGALDDLRARGITQLSYFQVDNPLVRPADPLFLGLHDIAGAGMSSKVVEKRDAAEKVGVLGRIDGRMGCIEYSDLPAGLREARDESGALRFRAGNIAVHALAVDFVVELTGGELRLPWHLARKKMSVVDETGALVERLGCKFETFVFDALARSPRSVTLEVDRREEFSPVKNAAGEDSPASARADLCRLHAGWAREAGHPLPEPDEEGVHPVEVDPFFAETRDEFLGRAPARPRVLANGHYYTHDR